MLGLKRKREDSEDIPRPSLRGGEAAVWKPTGANAIDVKKVKTEPL